MNINTFLSIVIGIILGTCLIVLAYVLAGCATVPPVPFPDTAEKVLTKFILAPDLFFTLTIIGVMAGVFAFLNGQKIGIPLIITCFVGLSMKLAVVRFGFWIGLLGAMGNIILLTYTILIKNRALREIVTGVEVFKKRIPTSSIKNNLENAQKHESTKSIVKKIKEKL